MFENKITEIEKLNNKRYEDYREFRSKESVINTRISMYTETTLVNFEKIPKDLVTALGIEPPKPIDKMNYEEVKQYSALVEKELSSLLDKIQIALETNDVSVLVGFESFLGIEQTSLTEGSKGIELIERLDTGEDLQALQKSEEVNESVVESGTTSTVSNIDPFILASNGGE